MSRSGRITAPGKMMVCGEYAVLDGAEAVVAAVDRRALLWWPAGDQTRSLPPEAQAARQLAEAEVGKVPGDFGLDVKPLRSGDQKLGLGSSAAAAAAAAAAVFAHQGHDLGESGVRERVLACAFHGHRAVAPRGSGADVAASVRGGFVRFQRIDDDYSARPMEWPPELISCVIWTGQQARTSDFLDLVEDLSRRDPASYSRRMDTLSGLSADFVDAIVNHDTSEIPSLCDAYADAMGALGEESGAGIMTDSLREIQTLARLRGGGAKPSGAGGGDVALGVFTDPGKAADFESACAQLGFTVLSLGLGAAGVKVEMLGEADES